MVLKNNIYVKLFNSCNFFNDFGVIYTMRAEMIMKLEWYIQYQLNILFRNE